MNVVIRDNLETRFGGSHPTIGDRDQFTDLSDEQYASLRWFQDVAHADFHTGELLDGTSVNRSETQYLYFVQMAERVAGLPEDIRVGLLSMAVDMIGGGFEAEYDPEADLVFLETYFMLDRTVIKDVAEVSMHDSLELGGRLASWGTIAWAKKAFPELMSDKQLRDIVQAEEQRTDEYSLGNLISGFMYHGDDKFVDRYTAALGLSKEFVQLHAWEAFIQNKLSWITEAQATEAPLEDIIKDSYLRYFPDRADLAREVNKTIAEFEDLIATGKATDGSYQTAVNVMKLLVEKTVT